MLGNKLKKAIAIAMRPDIVRRSLNASLVVGTILNLINQPQAFLDLQLLNVTQCLLTYGVPYCVATYGAVTSLMLLEGEH